jgi:hypothetical protein
VLCIISIPKTSFEKLLILELGGIRILSKKIKKQTDMAGAAKAQPKPVTVNPKKVRLERKALIPRIDNAITAIFQLEVVILAFLRIAPIKKTQEYMMNVDMSPLGTKR